jgi:hypothetical protein
MFEQELSCEQALEDIARLFAPYMETEGEIDEEAA